MGRRVNRKNTRRVNRKNTLRKNTGRKNTRRVNRKNTLRKSTRRVNRKNTKRVNRKNNLRKNKLYGGVKQDESVRHCQEFIDNDMAIPGEPGRDLYAFKYEGCPPDYRDRGQNVHFIIQDKSNGITEYKLATYYGFKRNMVGANEYTFQVGQDSHLEKYKFKNSDIYKACVIKWVDYDQCKNFGKPLADTFRNYTGDEEPVFKAASKDVMKKQAVVSALQEY